MSHLSTCWGRISHLLIRVVLWVYYSYHGWNNDVSGRLNNLSISPGQQATWQRQNHRNSHVESHFNFKSEPKSWRVWQHHWLSRLPCITLLISDHRDLLLLFLAFCLRFWADPRVPWAALQKEKTPIPIRLVVFHQCLSQRTHSLLHAHGHPLTCLLMRC